MTEVAPQQDINPRKKLYSALVGNANPDAKSHFKQFSFEQFNKRLDDEKFVEDLYESLRSNDVVLDAKNRQPEQNYYDFIDAYVKVPTAKPAAKPAAPVAAPVAAPIEQAAPIPSVEPMEEEEDIREVTLPEVTAYGNLPQPGTQLYEDIMRTNPPVGSDEYNLKIAVQNQIPTPELGAGGYGGVLQAPFETKAQIEQEAQSPVFRRQKLAEEMFSGNIPAVTQEDVRKAQRGFGAATKEQQEAAIMGGTGAELAQQREDEKLTKAQIVGEEANKFLSGLNRAIYKTPSAMAKTIGELGVGVINMLGGDMKSEESVLYSLADKYDKWLDTSEVARDWIGDPQYRGLATDVGSGLGQIATMIAAGPGGASRALMSRPGVIKSVAQKMFSKPSLIAGAQVFNSEYENMKAKGESDETAFKQALTNWFATAPLENLPIVNLAERLNKTVGVQATRRIINAIQQGAEEGGQEALQQLFSNFSNNALVELNKNVVDWTEGLQPSAEAGGVVGLLIGALANAKAAKGYSKPSGLSAFSPAVQENPIAQIATSVYQENISRAEEQGKKPNKWDVKQLEKLRNDPEAWVKGEIEYLTQKIEEDKKANIDTKRTEADLAEHNALLAQIKAEKKGMSGAAPVTPEVPAAPLETIEIAPETAAPITEEVPSEEVVVPPLEEDEDLAAFGRELEAIEQAAPVAPVEEAPAIAPLNIDFTKNEGRNVNYQGIQGRIKIDSDGAPYVFTKDGDVVYIEGGLSGQTPQQLGVQPLADDIINEADVETVLQDDNAPLDQNQLEYDFDNNTVTLYGKPFTYEGVETNSKGQTTALRLRDANGKVKFVRNEDTILEFEIQKELYEKSRTNKPITVESATAAADQLQVVPVARIEQVPQQVQQERPVSDIEGDEVVSAAPVEETETETVAAPAEPAATEGEVAVPEAAPAEPVRETPQPVPPAAPAPKGRKQAAPVTPAPAAPKPIEFGKQLEKKYGVRIDLLGKLDKGDLTLSRIEVPQTERGKGIGSKIMEEIIKYADENGKRIVLSPTKEFGATSVDRLRKFYKGFGFVENKGSNKDFTIKELMYRLPAKAEPAPIAEKEEGKKAEAKEEKVTPTSEALKDIDSKGYESQVVGPYVIIAGNVFDASKTQGQKWEYSDGKLISIQEKNKVIVKPESVRLSQKEAARLAQAYSVVERVDSEPFKPIINYIAAASGMSATELLETFGKGKPIPSSEYNLPFSDFEKSVRDILGKVKGLNDKISSAQIMEDYYLHHFGKAPSITKAENKLEASESIADFYGKPEAAPSFTSSQSSEAATAFDKALSASSRFRPKELVVFDTPIVGPNGNKLVAYQWAYEWTMKENKEGELVDKRISDWTQAESSAETGRDVVHKFTVQKTDGSTVTVSSETIPSLLGYVDAKQMKGLPSVVSAVKTLAKQRMQLAIMEAQEAEYKALEEKFEKADKPEVKEVADPAAERFGINKEGEFTTYGMGDVSVRQDNRYNWDTKKFDKVPLSKETVKELERKWVLKRIEEAGGKYPSNITDLRNRVKRQERRVEEATKSRITIKEQEGGRPSAEAKPPAPSFTSEQSSEAATAFDKARNRAKDSKDAQNHSADLSGEAYELEDGTGLIQGFNLMGKPVYSGYKKGKRTRVDIDSYTGDVFTSEELSALKELKKELEASEKAAQTQDPFKQQGRVAKTDSVPENVRKFVEDITKSLGIDKQIIVITDGDFNEGQYQKHGLYGTLAQVRSAKQSAINPYEYGSKRYMSDADAFYIYYDGKLKGDQLFTVVSHEIGHIVEQEVFNNSSEETKKAVKEDYEKWLASLTSKTVEEVAKETRDITLADLIEGNTRKFDPSKDRYISSFSEYFADNVAKWARTSAKPKSAVDKYFSGIVEVFKKLYDYVSEKGLYSKSLFEWLDGMYKAPAEAQFTSYQSTTIVTDFDKAKTSKGFDKKYGKGAYKALSDITKNFEDIMDKVSEKIKQDCII